MTSNNSWTCWLRFWPEAAATLEGIEALSPFGVKIRYPGDFRSCCLARRGPPLIWPGGRVTRSCLV